MTSPAPDSPQPPAADVADTGDDRAAKPTPLPGRSWAGKRFGRFKIVQLIGKGAMGSVFRAEDIRLKRHVALKVLPKPDPDNGDDAYKAEQFIREARSAARLDHPHIVRIYEVDEYKGWLYIAMELIEGGNLHALVKTTGPLDASKACALGAEAAEALHDAHKMGVLHRDIKPANLMLTRDGRCKLTDFGLARLEDPEDGFDMPTQAIGTPSFVAPETTVGQPATAQTEVYSLGATLFFLLTGRPVFPGKTVKDVVRHHRKTPAPRLDEVNPDLPADLADDIAKALAKKADDRFESCHQFAMVLRRHTVQVGAPAPATTPAAAPAPDAPDTRPAVDDLDALGDLAAASDDGDAIGAAQRSGRVARGKGKGKGKGKRGRRASPHGRRQPKPDRTPLILALCVAGLLILAFGGFGIYQLTRPAAAPESDATELAAAEGDTTSRADAEDTDASVLTAGLAGAVSAEGPASNDPAPPTEPTQPEPATQTQAPPRQPQAQPQPAAPTEPEPIAAPEPAEPEAVEPEPAVAPDDGLTPMERLRLQERDIPTSDASEQDTDATIIMASSGGAIAAAMEKRQPVIVEGTVSKFRQMSSGVRMHFNADTDFYIYMYSSVARDLERQFGGENGSDLIGKTVRVRGRIEPHYGKPQILAKEARQIQLVE